MTGPWRLPEGWSLRVVEHDGGVTRLEVRGDIDTVTAEPLTDTVRALTRLGGTVVVDLTEVTYLGSHGLAALVDADDDARLCGARLVVVPGTGNRTVTRPLELTCLDTVLDVREGSAQQITHSARDSSRSTDGGAVPRSLSRRDALG